ncbi:MAG: hypothetical protein HON53_13300 [Planctomycetaceae bacterium]|jgi:hypothetical protein|nr:hypothetical protein [Planctomycetaceae bacterium]MBT6155412.1 hypothetical protein [Planctomycetaceae bacterium]MBT6487594.1 hypothetical protein [Planctomycetaceae bacterium]MBT6493406.1 hypothetical protein [Planctomycetaceae bacterium]
MNSDNENNVDLDLQAFRYVGNDMADKELQQFEERLAGDQPAREAVARAVQIGQAVAFSQSVASQELAPLPARKSSRRRQKRLAIVAASVAVAFLAGVGISHWFEQVSPPILPIANSDADLPPTDGESTENPMVVALNSSAGHVLALWSESAPEFGRSVEDLADGFETGTNNDSEQLEMAIAASDSLISNDDDDSEFDLPSWMLAAVSPDEDSAVSPDSIPEEN